MLYQLRLYQLLFACLLSIGQIAPPPGAFGCMSTSLAVGDSNWIGLPEHGGWLFASAPGAAATPADAVDWRELPQWGGNPVSGPMFSGLVQVRNANPDTLAILCPRYVVFLPDVR